MNAWLGPVSATMQIASSIVVAGVPFFRCLNEHHGTALSARMSKNALTILILALSVFVAAHIGQLLAQLAVIADPSASPLTLASAEWQLYLRETRPGHIWLFRAALSLVLLVVVATWFFRTRSAPAGTAGHWLSVTVAGVLLVASAAWSGHYAGDTGTWGYLVLHAVHLTAVALWVGSLPLWWMTVRSASIGESIAEPMANILQRFSHAAMLLVVVAVGTGIPLAWLFINSQGDLLGTRWGLLLVMKVAVVALVLIAANAVRERLNSKALSRLWALRAVGAEAGLLCIVILLASLLAQTAPAAHEQPLWWIPFRLSYDAIAPYSSLVRILWSAIAMTVATTTLAALAYHRAGCAPVTTAWLCAALVATVVAAWAAAVPAYPDTFRRSDVPYVAESIASGMKIYGDNCVPCHGSGGRADGPLAPFTRLPPVDLAAPHTALHTAGDLYGWIGNGMPSGAMPGFANRLSEQDRWDLVNFLRVFSQGFQARVLNTHVVPEQSWLGAPDFYLNDTDGRLSQLKALRGKPALLLIQKDCTTVLTDRVELLTRWRRNSGVLLEIVATCPDQIKAPVAYRHTWFAQSAEQVISTYSLLSRTLENKGDKSMLGMDLVRAEFLVDRYGYIRARWIPGEDATGWAAPTTLAAELDLLSQEARIPPPPDSHIH